jgi:hypothetical protein
MAGVASYMEHSRQIAALSSTASDLKTIAKEHGRQLTSLFESIPSGITRAEFYAAIATLRSTDPSEDISTKSDRPKESQTLAGVPSGMASSIHSLLERVATLETERTRERHESSARMQRLEHECRALRAQLTETEVRLGELSVRHAFKVQLLKERRFAVGRLSVQDASASQGTAGHQIRRAQSGGEPQTGSAFGVGVANGKETDTGEAISLGGGGCELAIPLAASHNADFSKALKLTSPSKRRVSVGAVEVLHVTEDGLGSDSKEIVKGRYTRIMRKSLLFSSKGQPTDSSSAEPSSDSQTIPEVAKTEAAGIVLPGAAEKANSAVTDASTAAAAEGPVLSENGDSVRGPPLVHMSLPPGLVPAPKTAALLEQASVRDTVEPPRESPTPAPLTSQATIAPTTATPPTPAPTLTSLHQTSGHWDARSSGGGYSVGKVLEKVSLASPELRFGLGTSLGGEDELAYSGRRVKAIGSAARAMRERAAEEEMSRVQAQALAQAQSQALGAEMLYADASRHAPAGAVISLSGSESTGEPSAGDSALPSPELTYRGSVSVRKRAGGDGGGDGGRFAILTQTQLGSMDRRVAALSARLENVEASDGLLRQNMEHLSQVRRPSVPHPALILFFSLLCPFFASPTHAHLHVYIHACTRVLIQRWHPYRFGFARSTVPSCSATRHCNRVPKTLSWVCWPSSTRSPAP